MALRPNAKHLRGRSVSKFDWARQTRNSHLFAGIALLIALASVTPFLSGAKIFGGPAMASPAVSRLEIDRFDTKIDVQLIGEARKINSKLIREWVNDAANSVSAYYGHLGVKRLHIEVTATGGDDVGFASTSYNDDGDGIIEVYVGSRITRKQFKKDWTLTHEMMHLSFPLMDHEHRWLAEGIATYAEPIARVRTHLISEDQMWRELIHGASRGQPQEGDGGLNQSRTFTRWYWGGAIYCLLADVEMRKQSQNSVGLSDALKGISDHGGNIASEWAPDETLRVGDSSVGLHVLSELFDKMADNPVRTDLDSLWSELGVQLTTDGVVYNDRAPLARVRKKIVWGSSNEMVNLQ